MPEPPTEYTAAKAALVAFRQKILADLVGARIVAGLDANHESMLKYSGLIDNLSIVPYVFGVVREKALALKLKDTDVDIGMLTKIDAEYTGGLGLYPLNPPYQVPQRQLPQVDVYLYDMVKDIDLLRQTDMSSLQSFLLLQCASGTFLEAPDAENVYYDYYIIFAQSRRDSVIAPSAQHAPFSDWVTVKGVETHFYRKLTATGQTDYIWYHFYLLMDAGVYADTTLYDTPPVILMHPTFTNSRPTITMSIAGQGILSTNFGIFATPTAKDRPRIIGFQKIADAWTWTSSDTLWKNEWDITIVVEPEVGGTTTPPVGDYVWQSLSDHDITAFPSGGYAFDHWEFDDVDKGSANPISHETFKSQRIKAVFVPT